MANRFHWKGGSFATVGVVAPMRVKHPLCAGLLQVSIKKIQKVFKVSSLLSIHYSAASNVVNCEMRWNVKCV